MPISFPEADAQLVNFFQQVGTELVQGYKRPAPEDDGIPPNRFMQASRIK
jgi:hypothetical protein